MHTLTQISLLLLFLVHTMNELKLTGNCLLGSRPILSFDPVRLLLQKNCNGGFYVGGFIASMSRINKDFILMIFVPVIQASHQYLSSTVHFILFLFLQCFTGSPHYSLIKELFIKIFSTPYYHPKSKPFIDHMFHFGLLDNHIWFRNYQV